MSGAPYQWRADKGYLQPPTPPPAEPVMMYSPPPPYMAMFPQPVSYVPGPIGIHGLFAPPPPAYQISFAPLQQVAIPPPPPPYQPAEKEDKKPAEKEDKKPSIKKEDVKKLPPKKENDKKEGDEKLVFNCFEPPEILPGANYMFPQEHVTMHIFKTAAKVWEPKYKKRMLGFRMCHVDTQASVKSVIERVMSSTDAKECKKWAISEVMERGGGAWFKGSTIEYTSDKAKGTLASMGWDARRGKARPPVWVTIHLVE